MAGLMCVACGSIQSLWGVTFSSPIKATYLEILVKDPGQFEHQMSHLVFTLATQYMFQDHSEWNRWYCKFAVCQIAQTLDFATHRVVVVAACRSSLLSVVKISIAQSDAASATTQISNPPCRRAREGGSQFRFATSSFFEGPDRAPVIFSSILCNTLFAS